MLIQYNHMYMTRLAKIYLATYSKYGYEEASKWYHNFLDDGLRKRIDPFIRRVAEEQNLEMD